MRNLFTLALLLIPLVSSVLMNSWINEGLFVLLVHIVVVLVLLIIYAIWAWQSSTKANRYTQTLEAVKDLRGDLASYSMTLIAAMLWTLLPFTDWWAVANGVYVVQLIYYWLVVIVTGYELYVSAANSFESLRKTSEVSVSPR